MSIRDEGLSGGAGRIDSAIEMEDANTTNPKPEEFSKPALPPRLPPVKQARLDAATWLIAALAFIGVASCIYLGGQAASRAIAKLDPSRRFTRTFWEEALGETEKERARAYQRTSGALKAAFTQGEFLSLGEALLAEIGPIEAMECSGARTSWSSNSPVTRGRAIVRIEGQLRDVHLLTYLNKKDGVTTVVGFDVFRGSLEMERHSAEKDRFDLEYQEFPFRLGKHDLKDKPRIWK